MIYRWLLALHTLCFVPFAKRRTEKCYCILSFARRCLILFRNADSRPSRTLLRSIATGSAEGENETRGVESILISFPARRTRRSTFACKIKISRRNIWRVLCIFLIRSRWFEREWGGRRYACAGIQNYSLSYSR